MLFLSGLILGLISGITITIISISIGVLLSRKEKFIEAINNINKQEGVIIEKQTASQDRLETLINSEEQINLDEL